MNPGLPGYTIGWEKEDGVQGFVNILSFPHKSKLGITVTRKS